MLSEEEYSDKMIEAFIGKPEKILWYQNAFTKYSVNGIDVMRWHWSWWGFGAGPAFLLYRKQYIPALILFILSITLGKILMGTLLLMILSGGYATYFIYKGYKTKLAEIETNIKDKQKRIETMQAVGGYHSWVIWVYLIYTTLLFVYIVATMLKMNF